MKQTIIRTAEQEEYLHPEHKLFFVRDVVTAATNQYLSMHRGRIEPDGEIVVHSSPQVSTIYVLSGQVECTLGEDSTSFSGGSCIVAPVDVVWGLKNGGEQPVELLIVFTPPQC
ncbi:MAG: cupin [Desulfobacteraceae bacterium 4572_35.1]|nr:MAG: cupin [Desulfobacteraceae bacterium 4572_35.1]